MKWPTAALSACGLWFSRQALRVGDLAGIDPGAMWEDFKVGMEHFTRWERIAVVTDVEWIKNTIKIFGSNAR
jgi:SpoIIAA-like